MRRAWLTLSLALLAGCPREAPHEATLERDPLYDPVQVGEVYVVRSDEGVPLVSRARIESKDDQSVCVLVSIERPGIGTADPQRHVLDRRRGPFESKLREKTDEKVVGQETLTVSGIAFDCSVLDEPDPVTKGHRVKSWRSAARYPGLVKRVDDTGKTVVELIAVEPPGEAPRAPLAADKGPWASWGAGSVIESETITETSEPAGRARTLVRHTVLSRAGDVLTVRVEVEVGETCVSSADVRLVLGSPASLAPRPLAAKRESRTVPAGTFECFLSGESWWSPDVPVAIESGTTRLVRASRRPAD